MDTLGSREKGGLGCFFLLSPPPFIFSVSLPFYLLQNTMIMLFYKYAASVEAA